MIKFWLGCVTKNKKRQADHKMKQEGGQESEDVFIEWLVQIVIMIYPTFKNTTRTQSTVVNLIEPLQDHSLILIKVNLVKNRKEQ